MGQNIESGTEKQRQDISDCRVRRLENGMSVCLMKSQCAFALPFGNVCSHPQASQIAVSEHPPV